MYIILLCLIYVGVFALYVCMLVSPTPLKTVSFNLAHI